MDIPQERGELGHRMVTLKRTAAGIVWERGRAYLYKGKYPQLIVFTTSKTELDDLKQAFGGHSYAHGSGFIWVLSKRKELATLMQKMKPFLPSKNGFENVLAAVDTN